jgi:NADPH-dependent 7-cyano-7-deazaguanine reductase QueF
MSPLSQDKEKGTHKRRQLRHEQLEGLINDVVKNNGYTSEVYLKGRRLQCHVTHYPNSRQIVIDYS